MKVLLALAVILGGLLITKNSYAIESVVTGRNNLQVSGPTFNANAHKENQVDCPLVNKSTQKHGISLLTDTTKGSTTAH